MIRRLFLHPPRPVVLVSSYRQSLRIPSHARLRLHPSPLQTRSLVERLDDVKRGVRDILAKAPRVRLCLRRARPSRVHLARSSIAPPVRLTASRLSHPLRTLVRPFQLNIA